jgi:hypothetical protein
VEKVNQTVKLIENEGSPAQFKGSFVLEKACAAHIYDRSVMKQNAKIRLFYCKWAMLFDQAASDGHRGALITP